MLDQNGLERAIDTITGQLDEVNRFFVAKIAAQIKKIGELGPANVNRIVAMVETGASILEITTRLQEATGLTTQAIFQIYQAAVDDVYTDRRFAAALAEDPTGPRSREAKERLALLARNVAAQTAATMQNISNTTAISTPYQAIIDKAVLAVSSGQTGWMEATQAAVREFGYNGLQVHYASGYHRRLDTAVRQNIIDATNQIAQQGSLLMGDVLGYDAVELSAHPNSAPDHEPVQGRVFSRAEFDKMQAGQDFQDVDGQHYEGFARPIGEWNCGHIAMAFSTVHSKRQYTPQQLAQWRAANAQGCEVDGTRYSRYQVSQLMRQTETRVRRWKDAANAAKALNDMEGRRVCQRRINALMARYAKLADASGLPQRRERLIVEGFRMVKA